MRRTNHPHHDQTRSPARHFTSTPTATRTDTSAHAPDAEALEDLADRAHIPGRNAMAPSCSRPPAGRLVLTDSRRGAIIGGKRSDERRGPSGPDSARSQVVGRRSVQRQHGHRRTIGSVRDIAELLKGMREAVVVSDSARFGAAARMRYTEAVAMLDADVLVVVLPCSSQAPTPRRESETGSQTRPSRGLDPIQCEVPR